MSMKFLQDMFVVLPDGTKFQTVIGQECPKEHEKFFLDNMAHWLEGGTAKRKAQAEKATDDGARKSPDDKMANITEAKKK